MTNIQIVFTARQTVQLLTQNLQQPADHEVVVKMEYTAISGGTEKACLLALPNAQHKFPMSLGYSGVGYVVECGKKVEKVQKNDRVLVYHGNHASYNKRNEMDITKIEDKSISSLDAAFVVIASMSLGGVRKLKIEIGQSAMVIGLGILGIFATQFCKLNGANPVISVDLNSQRRMESLSLGADYAFDPKCSNFVDEIKALTKGNGISACVEATGASLAMRTALDCAAYMGRICLLGCTRVSDTAIDYYNDIHRPGIQLIGAHNFVRPKHESYPHHWTHHDDCRAILDLIAMQRLQPLNPEIFLPSHAPEIYKNLCEDTDFPASAVFDWRNFE